MRQLEVIYTATSGESPLIGWIFEDDWHNKASKTIPVLFKRQRGLPAYCKQVILKSYLKIKKGVKNDIRR